VVTKEVAILEFSILAFQGLGDRRTKNCLQLESEIVNSKIPNSGPWSRVDFSILGISGIRTSGIGKTENRGNTCITVSRIAKAGSALSWTTLFDIPGPGCSRGQESRDVES
jgi:hypothetical protein